MSVQKRTGFLYMVWNVCSLVAFTKHCKPFVCLSNYLFACLYPRLAPKGCKVVLLNLVHNVFG